MMVLPTLVLVFSGLMLGGHAITESYQLHQEAHTSARVASLEGDVSATEEGEWLCATRTKVLDTGLWKLKPLTLTADACALNPLVGRDS